MAAKVDYYFGELAGHPVGSPYPGRKEAMYAGLQDNWVPGISGNGDVGADCVTLNKGYADDEDHGEWILYTGAGGNDPSTKRQIAHQEITHHHNAALVYSEENGLPIRVLRGYRGEKPYAPETGYRYDGLYKVIRHWAETGGDGFRIWRFHLVRLTPEEARPWTPAHQTPAEGPVGGSSLRADIAQGDMGLVFDPKASKPAVEEPEGNSEPVRAKGVVQRIVRSTRVSQWVKELHDHTCQVCRSRLDLPVGQYSEGAHIRGVGSPHNGPDTADNLLCLCPNDHVLFDKGGIYIDHDLTVRDHLGTSRGRLATKPAHRVSVDHIAYHRRHHGFSE